MRRFDPGREADPDGEGEPDYEPDAGSEFESGPRSGRVPDADPSARIAPRTGPQGLRALAETLSTVTGRLFGKRGFAGSRVVADWPSIVGDALAARSVPEKVSYPPGGRGPGTLTVRIASGGLALELQHLEPLIVERINTYFGRHAVGRLRFVHAPLPERPDSGEASAPPSQDSQRAAAALAAGIENPRLRKALEDLGAHLLSQR